MDASAGVSESARQGFKVMSTLPSRGRSGVPFRVGILNNFARNVSLESAHCSVSTDCRQGHGSKGKCKGRGKGEGEGNQGER